MHRPVLIGGSTRKLLPKIHDPYCSVYIFLLLKRFSSNALVRLPANSRMLFGIRHYQTPTSSTILKTIRILMWSEFDMLLYIPLGYNTKGAYNLAMPYIQWIQSSKILFGREHFITLVGSTSTNLTARTPPSRHPRHSFHVLHKRGRCVNGHSRSSAARRQLSWKASRVLD